MEQIVVKTEVQPNGDILLFYVDESRNEVEDGTGIDQESESGVYLQNNSVVLNEDKYVIEEIDESSDINDDELAVAEDDTEKWLDEETNNLLIFYTDNKEAFLSGNTKRKHLWEVASRTMLHGKKYISCELKLKSLMKKYSEIRATKQDPTHILWPFYSLCHEAFNDDEYSKMLINDYINERNRLPVPAVNDKRNKQGILVMNKVNNRNTVDDKVETMLNLYIKHRQKFQKNESQRGLWELIVLEMGEQDVDYWIRRFLNYKQHYIRMLHKRSESGSDSIVWPYMKMFDQIFQNDEEFHQKNFPQQNSETQHAKVLISDKDNNSWSDMEKTFLVKYYFDCFNEFQDSTIPTMFLWTEVGRLLNKKPVDCKANFMDLMTAHINLLMKGGYDLENRVPMEIILDNIIAKETKLEIEKGPTRTEQYISWKDEQIDELVQYLYDNTEMLKDPICYYVCWSILAKKCNKSSYSCQKQWDTLVEIYKTLLNDKKENPDMLIEWRYIDMFDRILDYGMAADLLDGSGKLKAEQQIQSGKIGVKKITIKDIDNNLSIDNGTEDEETFDERGFTKHSKKGSGDSKAFKILEFYLKNKHKFSSSQYKRVALWETLSKQIGIPATECAHRFRNFKQVYKAYVKREISKPEKPILWPYYPLCKKVFGYRSIKAKLKNDIKAESEDEDWSAKEIKTLISFFARNFHELQDKIGDSSKWISVANELGRLSSACSDKFMELRKSYRKLKTMKTRNSQVKVSWKYFNLMDEVYTSEGANIMDDIADTIKTEDMIDESDIKQELQDEDYTIIVIPESEDINDLSNAQYIIQDDDNILKLYDDNGDTIVQEYDENGDSIAQEYEENGDNTVQEFEENRDNIVQEFEENRDNIVQEFEENRDNVVQEHSKEMEFSLNEDTSSIKESDQKPKPKWTKRSKKRLVILYLNYLRSYKGKEIRPKDMWTEIASKFGDRKPITCKKMFIKLKNRHKQAVAEDTTNSKIPYFTLFEKILSLKPKFVKKLNKSGEGRTYKDYPMDESKVELALKYYLQNIDEFISPKFEKRYLWTELAQYVSEPVSKVFNKVNFLIQFYKSSTLEAENTRYGEILKEIFIKESLLNDVPMDTKTGEEEIEYTWTEDEVEILLTWYLAHLEKFKNPKFVRSYLWMEASDILRKSPWACSNKMSEVRTQYRTMVKENPEGLNGWRFSTLCQRIYGTGKKCVQQSL